MAIVREQYKVWQGGVDASPDITFDSNVTAGSLLLIVASTYATSASFSVADNQGNTWNELYENNYDGADWGYLAYAMNASSGSTTVTLTVGGSNQYHGIVIIEVSGIKTSAALDQNNENTATASSWRRIFDSATAITESSPEPPNGARTACPISGDSMIVCVLRSRHRLEQSF